MDKVKLQEEILEALNNKIAQHEKLFDQYEDGGLARISECGSIQGLVEAKNIIIDIFLKGCKNV